MPAPSLKGVPFLAILDEDQETRITWSQGPFLTDATAWPEACRQALEDLAHQGEEGGLVGFVGYEAGAACERMPPSPAPVSGPSVLLAPAHGWVVLDRHGAPTVRGSAAFRREAAAALDEGLVDRVRRTTTPRPQEGAARPKPVVVPGATSAIADRYKAGVSSILGSIRDGDVYQVNLAWQSGAFAITDPFQQWLDLRATNPARRGAYLRWQGWEWLSNSPELFMEVQPSADGTGVRSVPIKGTCRAEDDVMALRDSEKERAELTMIVDLVRNDIGRVARPGSVQAGPRTLVPCGDLVHAEQEVRAVLDAGRSAVDAFCAMFPPGSVTGAPKVAAMDTIARLETAARGVYTGAIGRFSADGTAHWNVAIRTAVARGGAARFHVGAGIVADSDPEREWYETLAKARALSRALA